MSIETCTVCGGLISEETGNCPQCQQSMVANQETVPTSPDDRTEILQRPHMSQYDPTIFFFIEDNILYRDEITSDKDIEKFNERLASNDYGKFKSLVLDNGEISIVNEYLVFTSGEGKNFRLEFSDAAVAEATFTELLFQLDMEDNRTSREITGSEKFARAKASMIFTVVWIVCFIGMLPLFAYLSTLESISVPVILIPFLKLGPEGCMLMFGALAIIACLIAVKKLKQSLTADYIKL